MLFLLHIAILLSAFFQLGIGLPSRYNDLCIGLERHVHECSVNNNTAVMYIPKSNVLCVNGDIDKTLKNKIISIPVKDDLLVSFISPGGIVNEAIDIVEYLEKFNYSIFVYSNCVSACAQFIFMGAKHKIIYKKAVIAMHGGPIPRDKIISMDIPDKNKESLLKENLRFKNFYKKRFIDIKILLTPPKYVQLLLDEGKIVFWMPLEKDFLKYNVLGIKYCNYQLAK